jgi:hypothetical protein
MSVSSTGEVLSTITTAYADTTTALGDLGFEDSTVTILGLNGTTIGTFDTTGEMTIGELFAELSTFGITGNINNGIITLDATNNCYATGGVISAMGIGVADRNYTTTIGGANTSTESVSTTYVVTANSSTTLGELGYTVPSEITISSSDGAELGKITTSADMTIGDMLLSFAGYGISGNISNGYIRLNSPNGNYVTGDLMTSMGITTSESTYTSTEGITSTSSAITYNKTTGAENTSKESVTYTNVIEETVMTTTAIVVTTTATTTKSWAIKTGDKWETKDAAHINAYLIEHIPAAIVYKSGQTYYYIDIKHLGTSGKGAEYGIVRNHIYDIEIQSIKGYGTPVYSPDSNLVKPETPTDEQGVYVAAKIKVLSWRVVKQGVNIEVQ